MSDTRLTELETKYAWLERHVAEQDKAMLELGEQIRQLRRELEALRSAMSNAAAAEPEPPEPPPPHH